MPTQEQGTVEVLQENTCWELVRGTAVGRLAVVLDGQPEIFPVNHVVDQGTVVFRTAVGSKLDAANGRRVAFEVDGVDLESGFAWSVVVKGRAHALRSLQDVVDSFGLPLYAWHQGPKPIFVRIEVDAVSGRRFRPQFKQE
jgi:nitroimidazol reductase NimA-like FMN-containing flavoprotein (pyridoxamine 5'-phosphate oxidase superfamily)